MDIEGDGEDIGWGVFFRDEGLEGTSRVQRGGEVKLVEGIIFNVLVIIEDRVSW